MCSNNVCRDNQIKVYPIGPSLSLIPLSLILLTSVHYLMGELYNDLFLNYSASKTVKVTSEICTQESSLNTAEIVPSKEIKDYWF